MFEAIKGANREEAICFIQEFPEEEYTLHDVPNLGKFYLDAIDDIIKNELRMGKCWEQGIVKIIQAFAKPGSTVLDIGAHIGTHTLSLSKQSAKVLAFEPQPKLFRELFLNMQVNAVNNVEFYPVAIGAGEAWTRLSQLCMGNEGGTPIEGGSGTLVPLIAIDSLPLENVSFIKIDVERMENAVLQGAQKTIAHFKPVMIVEIQGGYALETAPSEIKRKIFFTLFILQKMGYEVERIGHADYLATPSSS